MGSLENESKKYVYKELELYLIYIYLKCPPAPARRDSYSNMNKLFVKNETSPFRWVGGLKKEVRMKNKRTVN